MVEWIMEPLRYGFFVRGIVAGLIVSLSCGILSAFVVWRGMAFIGDALAHAVLPGIVIAIMLGVHILAGAMLAALLAVFAIVALSRHRGFKEDTAIGVIFSGAFALGILLMSKVSSFSDLTHILFGNILAVNASDLVSIALVGLVVAALMLLFYKELLVTSFDWTHSSAIGLSPTLMQLLLLVLVAATTVIATRTVGVVLVMALLVTPAATASLVFSDMGRIMMLSVVLSGLAVIIGFYSSYYLDLASGASIVLVLSTFFIIAYCGSRYFGSRRG